MQRVGDTGSKVPAKIGGYRRAILEGHEDHLRDLMRTRKDITLDEIKSDLAAQRITTSKSAIWTMLRKLGLSHKKSR